MKKYKIIVDQESLFNKEREIEKRFRLIIFDIFLIVFILNFIACVIIYIKNHGN